MQYNFDGMPRDVFCTEEKRERKYITADCDDTTAFCISALYAKYKVHLTEGRDLIIIVNLPDEISMLTFIRNNSALS